MLSMLTISNKKRHSTKHKLNLLHCTYRKREMIEKHFIDQRSLAHEYKRVEA